MAKIHYIAMQGDFGYIPDDINSFDDLDQAIQWLEGIFKESLSDSELNEMILALLFNKNRVYHFGYTDLPDYCEIQECICDTPEDHGDS